MFRLEGDGGLIIGCIFLQVGWGGEFTVYHHPSFLRRGLFVLWGGWGERKRERAGHDRKGKERRDSRLVPFPIFPRALSIFPIIANFIGIPSRSLSERATTPLRPCGWLGTFSALVIWKAVIKRNYFCWYLYSSHRFYKRNQDAVCICGYQAGRYTLCWYCQA